MYATKPIYILLATLFARHALAIPTNTRSYELEERKIDRSKSWCSNMCTGGNLAITVTNTSDGTGNNWCARGDPHGVTLTNGITAYGWDQCVGVGNGLITGVEPDFSSNDCTMHLDIAAQWNNQGIGRPFSVMATVEASLAATGTVGPYQTSPEGGGETVSYPGLDYGILIFATGWTTKDPWIFQTNGVNSTEMYPVQDSLWSVTYAHLEAKFDCASGVFAKQGP